VIPLPSALSTHQASKYIDTRFSWCVNHITAEGKGRLPKPINIVTLNGILPITYVLIMFRLVMPIVGGRIPFP
jgi:hypothetical protein